MALDFNVSEIDEYFNSKKQVDIIPQRQAQGKPELIQKAQEGIAEEQAISSGAGVYQSPTTGEPIIAETGGAEPTFAAFDLSSPFLKVGAGLAGIGATAFGLRKGYKAIEPARGKAKVGKFMGLSSKEASEKVKDVPYKHKPFALAQQAKFGETKGIVKEAIREGGDPAARFARKDLRARLNVIKKTIGADEIDRRRVATRGAFNAMVKAVAKDNKNSYDGTSMIADLDVLEKLGARSDASERTVTYLKNKLADNPNVTLEQALDFRKEINAELRSATGDHAIRWGNLKKNVDKFIDANTDKNMKKFIDDTIDLYADMKTNEELIDIINKHGGSTEGYVDWKKAGQAIREAKLSSPETEQALKIVDEFTEKFGMDVDIFKASETHGSGEATGALGTLSYLVAQLKDSFALWGIRHDNVIAQNAILRSIMDSSTVEEFAKRVIKNPKTPADIRKNLRENLKAIKNDAATTPSSKPKDLL